jgi:hypothetical protein
MQPGNDSVQPVSRRLRSEMIKAVRNGRGKPTNQPDMMVLRNGMAIAAVMVPLR